MSAESQNEALLADFLDAALDRLARGEPVSASALLGPTPELLERGVQLLNDARELLGVARGVQDQSQLLRSDWVALGSGETLDFIPADVATAPERVPDPFPGEFRLQRLLGSGAFGSVWLAEDLHLRRLVALKTLLPPGSAREAEDCLASLRAEARLLAALSHPNIVQVYAWREVGQPLPRSEGRLDEPRDLPHCYLVLQYIPGGSLADRVLREGPLSWQLAARYIADIAEGLLQVHARGILHRDIKPANILWDSETDEAVLTDFGISARMREASGSAGTPVFMAPEAAQGRNSPAQDVFSLAASLFWLATAAVPFPGSSLSEICHRVERGLPEFDSRCATMPAILERALRAALALKPEARPRLDEFLAQLRGALNQALADTLQKPRPAAGERPRVHLTLSRQVDRWNFAPLTSTQPREEHQLRDLQRVPAAPARVEVHTGERVRLEVETEQAGYLTVFNVGPGGNLNLLYPESQQATPVQPGQPVQVLDIELTPPAGRERVFALWTRERLPLRLDELLSLVEKGTWGPTRSYRATRDMKKLQESVEHLRPGDWSAAVLEVDHCAS